MPKRRRLWAVESGASAAGGLPITRLTCHAPHQDPEKVGECCGTLLAHARGRFAFVMTAEDDPQTLDEVARTALEQGSTDTWLRCGATHCGKWNRFKIESS